MLRSSTADLGTLDRLKSDKLAGDPNKFQIKCQQSASGINMRKRSWASLNHISLPRFAHSTELSKKHVSFFSSCGEEPQFQFHQLFPFKQQTTEKKYETCAVRYPWCQQCALHCLHAQKLQQSRSVLMASAELSDKTSELLAQKFKGVGVYMGFLGLERLSFNCQ